MPPKPCFSFFPNSLPTLKWHLYSVSVSVRRDCRSGLCISASFQGFSCSCKAGNCLPESVWDPSCWKLSLYICSCDLGCLLKRVKGEARSALRGGRWILMGKNTPPPPPPPYYTTATRAARIPHLCTSGKTHLLFLNQTGRIYGSHLFLPSW